MSAALTVRRLWANENIRRDDDSGAYYAEFFSEEEDGWPKWVQIGSYNSWDDAMDALIGSRCRGES